MDHPQPSTSGVQKAVKKKKTKIFNNAWLKIEAWKGWLTPYINDNTKAFCIPCNKILSCGKSELMKHSRTASHLNQISKDRNINNPSAVLPLNNLSDIEKVDHFNKVKRAEIKLAAFYAEHNVAFRTLEHMVPLMKEIYPDSQIATDLTLSRTKCTQIVKNVIAKRENNKTAQNLRQQKFSLLIDESTTITNDKLLCILVRYVSPETKRCITELLELIELDAKDCCAENVYLAFERCLQKNNIPFSNIVGMACDNASIMIGVNDSFVTRLRKEVPALILLKCICHSSALVASKACSKLPDSCENLLHAVSTYMSSSAKRSAILCDFQEFFGVESRKILKLSGTRWLILQKCITRLLDNWEVLKHYFFLETIETKNNSSQSILNILNDNLIKAYMLFLKYSLNFFNTFNALFQSRKVLVHKLSENSERIIKQMGQNFLLPAVLENLSLDILQPQNFLPLHKIRVGQTCELFLQKQSSDFSNEVKSNCLNFYITATEEMLKRLPFNNKILRDLEFLDSNLALRDQERQGIIGLLEVAKHFEQFDITALEYEWTILPTEFTDAEKNNLALLEIDEMWKKIFEKQNFNDESLFPNLEKLVNAVLSLPHSNAEAERIFSIVTDVKNKKRNRMTVETLNAICKTRSTFQAKNINCINFQVDSEHLELHKQNLYTYGNKTQDDNTM